MNRATYVISRFYTKLVLRNPVTLFAMAGMIAYSALTSSNDIAIFQHNAEQLNVLEVIFYIFNSQLYTTYGLFFPFLFVVFPMFYAKDLERLIAWRAYRRSDIWTAKVFAIMQITIMFLGVALFIVLAAVLPNYPFSLEWSDAFGQLVRESARPSLLNQSEYLYWEYNPLSVAIVQTLLFLVGFMLVGVLGAVLVQLFERQMVAFIAVSLYWIVALVPWMVPSTLVFLSPATHLVLHTRSLQFPFALSFLYFASALVIFVIFGSLRAQKINLGE